MSSAIGLAPQAQAESLLWQAVSDNDVGRARTLITLGADVNYKNPYAHKGNAEIVELLITKGADVNAKNRFGRTPLHWTIKKEIATILLALTDNGAR